MEDAAATTAAPAPPEGDGPSNGLPNLPGPMPVWRLYVLAVSTLCVYLPFWVCGTARQFGVGARFRRTPVWWALGTVAAPVAACVLYEFNRRATAVGRKRGRGAAPALAYLGIVILWGLSPLGGYVLAFLLLAPIPFLFVQRNINRAGCAEGRTAHPPRRMRVLHWVGLVAGIPALAATFWFIDLPVLETDLASRLATGTVVAGRSGLYDLTIHGGGWRRVDSGTIGDPETDLEFVGPGEDTWVLAYTNPSDDYDLESSVWERRAMLFDGGTPMAFEETRTFLDQGEFVPVSTVTCQVSYGVGGIAHYVVLTVELDDHVVELIGQTSEPGEYADQLLELLRTFSLRPREEEP